MNRLFCWLTGGHRYNDGDLVTYTDPKTRFTGLSNHCMAEYIEKEALIAYANNCTIGIDANDIARFPAADVVEVVRCKDCRYWGGKYSSNECSKITELANPDYWLKTSPDDFCSSGERKDGIE